MRNPWGTRRGLGPVWADTFETCLKVMGELRLKLGRDLGLIDDAAWKFLWVVDFPMFERDEEPVVGKHPPPLHQPHAGEESKLERLLAIPSRRLRLGLQRVRNCWWFRADPRPSHSSQGV